MFKVNNRNTRRRCEICSKLTIKTPERRHVFIVNFKHISHLVLVFLLLTLSRIVLSNLELLKICFFTPTTTTTTTTTRKTLNSQNSTVVKVGYIYFFFAEFHIFNIIFHNSVIKNMTAFVGVM